MGGPMGHYADHPKGREDEQFDNLTVGDYLRFKIVKNRTKKGAQKFLDRQHARNPEKLFELVYRTDIPSPIAYIIRRK